MVRSTDDVPGASSFQSRPGYTDGMDNFVVLETFFTVLVALAGLGTIGVAAKVITNLFKSRR